MHFITLNALLYFTCVFDLTESTCTAHSTSLHTKIHSILGSSKTLNTSKSSFCVTAFSWLLRHLLIENITFSNGQTLAPSGHLKISIELIEEHKILHLHFLNHVIYFSHAACRVLLYADFKFFHESVSFFGKLYWGMIVPSGYDQFFFSSVIGNHSSCSAH